MKLDAHLAILLAVGVLVGACADKPAADASGEAPRLVASLVNATAVVSACPDARKMNGKAATETLNKLVEPCAQVPGGRAHFSATLEPGGKIELASPEGNTAEGVVPTCVLGHGLTHKVFLTKPCRFDVNLEERKVAAPPK
jgi:hypothetical protein